MRPVDAKYATTQRFGEGATAGVIGNPYAPQDTIEYYVGIYGDYQHEGHAGEDIGCPVGTPIYAPADGTVLYAGWVEDLPGTGPVRGWLLYWNFGGIVTVTQHDGWISVIGHQSDNNMVHAGMSVKEGQLIGKSGNTKTRTTQVAPHVHVEALVYTDYRTDVARGIIYGRVDPRRYFGSGGAAITAQSITTPTEEFLMALTDKEQADLYRLVKEGRDASVSAREAVWYGGESQGKKFNYGILPIVAESQRRQSADAATIKNLVSALAAVAKGEPFDEAKLLAGVQAAAEAGVKAGIADGTVTVDVNIAGGAK